VFGIHACGNALVATGHTADASAHGETGRYVPWRAVAQKVRPMSEWPELYGS
jgi:hypothetical protein